jgi:hypothetical protein
MADFSEDEIEAVREYTNLGDLPHCRNTKRLHELHLWDVSHGDFNERGAKIKNMLIGSRSGSHAEMAVIYRWNWGKHSGENMIALEQELLNMGLAWVNERGRVCLTGRGQMLSQEAHFRER